MYRAIMEGVAYQLRLQREGVDGAIGEPLERFVAIGGGSRSAAWCQMVADVTGVPVTLSREAETTALGAAVLAAAAVELHGDSDIRTAARTMAHQGRTFEPDEAMHRRYDPFFAIYSELYPRLRDVFAEIARATSAEGSDG
jgi:xylulokinase